MSLSLGIFEVKLIVRYLEWKWWIEVVNLGFSIRKN